MSKYDPRKPLPFPVRILLKMGVKSVETANKIVITTSVILIIISVYLLQKNTSSDVRELTEEQMFQLNQ